LQIRRHDLAETFCRSQNQRCGQEVAGYDHESGEMSERHKRYNR